jgi:hypothetical protein
MSKESKSQMNTDFSKIDFKMEGLIREIKDSKKI